MRGAILLVAVALLNPACSKNEPTNGPEQVFITYTSADGLASNEVAALQLYEWDSEGDDQVGLWAADPSGNLSYFNISSNSPVLIEPDQHFRRWLLYPRPDSLAVSALISTAAADSLGIYLNAWPGGLVQFRLGRWRSVEAPFTDAGATETDDKGILWVSGIDNLGYNGLWRLTDSGWESVLNAGRDFFFGEITDILPAGDGELWLATWGSGLIHYQDGASEFIQAANGLPSDYIERIRPNGDDGGLWLVTPKGFYLFEDGAVSEPFDNAYLTDRMAFDISRDHLGRYWFATRSNGVLMNPGGAWVEFTEEHGLASNYVTAITTLDKGENEEIWVGTRAGISQYTGD